MANVKITQLPAVSSVANGDILPIVATAVTSQLTVKNLANSLPQVTSSISASYAVTASYAVSASYEITYETSSSYADYAKTASYVENAQTASYVVTALTASYVVTSLTASYVENAQTASYYDFTGTNIISSSLQFDDLTAPFSGSFTGSFTGDGTGLTGVTAFPFTGSAEITGSLRVTGSAKVSLATYANATYAASFQPYNGFYGVTPLDPVDPNETGSIAPSWWGSSAGAGVLFGASADYYASDQNIGQIGLLDSATFNRWAGAIKLLRDNVNSNTTTGKIPYHTLITNNATLTDSNATFALVAANGRNHVLTVTGSLLGRDGVTLGTNIANQHYLSGSLNATGSFTWRGGTTVSASAATATGMTVQNGHVVLAQVSASLDFADDTAAAAGGVPLGGLYRNGNLVCIRIS